MDTRCTSVGESRGRKVVDQNISLIEQLEEFHGILGRRAEGKSSDGDEESYVGLRESLIADPVANAQLPRFVRINRTLDEFWLFIKYKNRSYGERRMFLKDQFDPLIKFLEESSAHSPVVDSVERTLTIFDTEEIRRAWGRVSKRLDGDPAAAITSARSLVESVCKHILDEIGEEYDDSKDVFGPTAKLLKLAPDQQSEQTFRRMTGACQSIVGSVESIRNLYGDAHGKGGTHALASPRHAELAVNAAGTLAVFLIQTWQEQCSPTSEGPHSKRRKFGISN